MSPAAVPDLNALTGALKSYLRELPDKLFTSEAGDAWIAASRNDPHGTALVAVCATPTSLTPWTRGDDGWIDMPFGWTGKKSPEERVDAFRQVIENLPVPNRETLVFLFRHLHRYVLVVPCS